MIIFLGFVKFTCPISLHNDCRPCAAFFFEFQQNSNIATKMASANPHNKTTKTPPALIK